MNKNDYVSKFLSVKLEDTTNEPTYKHPCPYICVHECIIIDAHSISAVFLNSLILAVEHYNEPKYVEMFLDRANYFFLCLFTVEMLIKVYALGPHVYARYVPICFLSFQKTINEDGRNKIHFW